MPFNPRVFQGSSLREMVVGSRSMSTAALTRLGAPNRAFCVDDTWFTKSAPPAGSVQAASLALFDRLLCPPEVPEKGSWEPIVRIIAKVCSSARSCARARRNLRKSR